MLDATRRKPPGGPCGRTNAIIDPWIDAQEGLSSGQEVGRGDDTVVGLDGWGDTMSAQHGQEDGKVTARRHVLLLNASFEPLTTLPLRRAILLVLREKAEIVHEDGTGAVLHSATRAYDVPSVIRLRRYINVPYTRRVPLTRVALMRRDRYTCGYCGKKAETIDHVIPRSRGGAHVWENVVAACKPCNHRKADKFLDALGWKLTITPTVPKGPHWRLVNGDLHGDPLWEPYMAHLAA